jgi:hypothetical protein
MDISKIADSYRVAVPQANNRKDKAFRQILDLKLSEINATTVPSSVKNKTDIIEHSDNILNLLDDYTNSLTNPAKTLKDIEPLVESIEKEVGFFEAGIADKIHDDKELNKLTKDLTVIANVAAYKFHRGDYI